MATTFDGRINELEQKKSELNTAFLQTEKNKYEQEISKLLNSPIYEWEEETAITKFNEVRKIYLRIRELEYEILHIPEIIEDIDKKINFYNKKRKSIRELPLYRNTQEWISEILWENELYQYAKENNNKKLVEQLENRTMTESEYIRNMEFMYKELFKQKSNLPEWMEKQIYDELKNNNEISSRDIIDFLEKELKKNWWEIKISHIKNRFKIKSSIVIKYIKQLISWYPEFHIIDNSAGKENGKFLEKQQTKREKLISWIVKNETEDEIQNREKKEKLLKQLNEIWLVENLEQRVHKYGDLYEELWFSFADKEYFILELNDAISTYNHIQLEREIQKILTNIIKDNLRPSKTEKYWYLVYKFGRSCDNRRIVFYPNWEIFTICSHSDYEKIISTQPPIEKR